MTVKELLNELQQCDPEEIVEIWGNTTDDGKGFITVGDKEITNI